eukprot:jgi/Hompol1/4713/HPOL_003833-RA
MADSPRMTSTASDAHAQHAQHAQQSEPAHGTFVVLSADDKQNESTATLHQAPSSATPRQSNTQKNFMATTTTTTASTTNAKMTGSHAVKKNAGIQLWSNIFLSNWFYLWVVPIIAKARSPKVNFAKVKLSLRHGETARVNTDLLEKHWNDEQAKNPKSPKFIRALWATFGVEYAMIALYKISWTFFTWAGAWYLLKLILNFLTNKGEFLNGHMYAMSLFLASIFSSIAIHQQYGECNRVGIKVKAAITGLVYRKSLRVSRLKGGAGEVINILSTDVTRINDAVVNCHFLWAAFVEVVLILGISFYEISLSALPALAFVLILLPVQIYLGRRTNDLNREQTATTTERVHLMSEILTAIKLIKFYAWEAPFTAKIEEIRKKEIDIIYRGLLIKTINFTVVFAIPVLVALTCLSTYVATGNQLTASVSFTVLSVFNTLRYPFFMLPMAVKASAGALTAFARLEEFYRLEEVEELKVTQAPAGSNLALEINGCDFKWDGAEGSQPTLSNISLSIKKGSRVAIVGDVGSGKSSLVAALLGQIRQIKGPEIKLYGTTAYMSQEAWILNMTLRQNILFGKEMDKQRYAETIRVSGLQRDLTLLLSADQTELAERLQYLSQMDHIIFVENGTIRAQGKYTDLMATDAVFADLVSSHVAEDEDSAEDDSGAQPMNDKNFEIVEPKAPASRPLSVATNKSKEHLSAVELAELNGLSVTSRNQLSVRNWRDVNENTIRSVIDKQNATTILGAERSHDVAQVMARNEISVYSLNQAKQSSDDEDDDEDEESAILRGKLVQDDESTNSAGFGDFLAYARAGSGSAITLSVVVLFALVHCIRIAGDFWLRLWVPRIGNYSDSVYIGVYGCFAILFSLGALIRGLLFSQVTTFKASRLHDKLFDAVIHAPMAFFDTTPLGRILSAFSKHQLHVDDTMLDSAMQALQYFPLGLGALVLCAVLIPWNWAPAIGIVCLAYLVVRATNPADIKTKSLEAITKPPIYAHLTATLEGLFSVRAYHAQDRFDAINLARVDTNHEALFAMQCVKSFQALYLDILSSLIIYFSAFLLVINRDVSGIAAVAGLALSNALQMLVFVQWTVRMWGEVETQMASVGQLVYYGKSTLLVSLLRIVESSEGRITIDDLDVSQI